MTDYSTPSSNLQEGVSPNDDIVGTVGIPRAKFDFRKHHNLGHDVGTAAIAASDDKRGWQYRGCGEHIFFGVNDSGRHLRAANFCHQRLCPLCDGLKAERNSRALAAVMTECVKRYPGTQYAMLTLEQRSVDSDRLKDEIGHILSAWRLLSRRKAVKAAMIGAHRALEVTRNPRDRDHEWHPHLHIVLALKDGYFARRNGLYINQHEWLIMWRRCLGIDYLPGAHIEALYYKDPQTGRRVIGTTPVNVAKAAKEGAKYAAKHKDILKGGDIDDQGKAWRVLFDALAGRKLTHYTGALKEIASDLDADPESLDLIHALDDEGERLAYQLYEYWRWYTPGRDYRCERIIPADEGAKMFGGRDRATEDAMEQRATDLGLIGPGSRDDREDWLSRARRLREEQIARR